MIKQCLDKYEHNYMFQIQITRFLEFITLNSWTQDKQGKRTHVKLTLLYKNLKKYV